MEVEEYRKDVVMIRGISFKAIEMKNNTAKLDQIQNEKKGIMAKVFRFRAAAPVDEVLDRIAGECASAGLRMNRGTTSGSLGGMGVSATYEVSGESVTLSVNKIPFFVSWGTVEKEVSRRAVDYGLILTGKENADVFMERE